MYIWIARLEGPRGAERWSVAHRALLLDAEVPMGVWEQIGVRTGPDGAARVELGRRVGAEDLARLERRLACGHTLGAWVAAVREDEEAKRKGGGPKRRGRRGVRVVGAVLGDVGRWHPSRWEGAAGWEPCGGCAGGALGASLLV